MVKSRGTISDPFTMLTTSRDGSKFWRTCAECCEVLLATTRSWMEVPGWVWFFSGRWETDKMDKIMTFDETPTTDRARRYPRLWSIKRSVNQRFSHCDRSDNRSGHGETHIPSTTRTGPCQDASKTSIQLSETEFCSGKPPYNLLLSRSCIPRSPCYPSQDVQRSVISLSFSFKRSVISAKLVDEQPTNSNTETDDEFYDWSIPLQTSEEMVLRKTICLGFATSVEYSVVCPSREGLGPVE